MVVLGSLLLAGALLGACYAFYLLPTTPSAPGGALPAAITKIPAPSATPILATPTSAVAPSATPPVSPTPFPGSVLPGAFVQIAGTGGDGLRLRADPGLDSQIRFLALEAEVFEVVEGPRVADNYTWWYLVAPYDEARSGWAVADYLAVIQNP